MKCDNADGIPCEEKDYQKLILQIRIFLPDFYILLNLIVSGSIFDLTSVMAVDLKIYPLYEYWIRRQKGI